MHKVKSIFLFTIFALTTFLSLTALANPATARQLTSAEKKKFGQNNILFYVPCDTEEDCEPAADDGEDVTPTEDPPGDPDTPAGEGAELIVNFAIKASWPDSSGKCRIDNSYVTWYNVNNPEGCKNTINDFAKSYGFIDGFNPPNTLQDCGRFVGFVLRKTVDSGASTYGTYSQSDHLDATPSKWRKVSTDGQRFPEAQLQPGDILIFGTRGGSATEGHIKIYIGDQTVACGNGSTCRVNIAQASYQGRTPYLSQQNNATKYGEGKFYSVYRYIGT